MTDSLLERAQAAFDVRSFVERVGGHKESANPASIEYLVTCPWCGSSRCRWRHGLDPDGTLRRAWTCWSCKRSGNSVQLIGALLGGDEDTAISLLVASYHGGDAPERLSGLAPIAPRRAAADTSTQVATSIDWPADVDRLVWGSPHHRAAERYLRGRHVTPETSEGWNLGVGRHGKLRGYVVFPCYAHGALVYWQARATWDPPPNLGPEQRKAWIQSTHYRKTLNPPASAAGVVLGYDSASRFDTVVIVEGPFDAINVGPHAVALLGKSATEPKIATLRRMARVRRWVVYLDHGAEAEARKLAEGLCDLAAVDIVAPPAGWDAGGLTRDYNAAWIAANAKPYQGARLTGI